MKKLFFLVCLLLISTIAFSQWTWQNPLPQGTSLKSICFTSADIGFAVGDYGTILKTINGGTTWTALQSWTTIDLTSVYFPDAMNYYLNNLKIIGSMYQPYGKCIIQYLVGWTVTVGSPWDHLHYTQITYGIPVSAIGPPETLQD